MIMSHFDKPRHPFGEVTSTKPVPKRRLKLGDDDDAKQSLGYL